jgi:hypothetical protein
MFDSASWQQLRERYLLGLDDEEDEFEDGGDAGRLAPPSRPNA